MAPEISWVDSANNGGEVLEVVSLESTNHLVRKSGDFLSVDSETSLVRFVGTLPIRARPYDQLIAVAPAPDYETTGHLYTLQGGFGVRVVLRWHIGFNEALSPNKAQSEKTRPDNQMIDFQKLTSDRESGRNKWTIRYGIREIERHE